MSLTEQAGVGTGSVQPRRKHPDRLQAEVKVKQSSVSSADVPGGRHGNPTVSRCSAGHFQPAELRGAGQTQVSGPGRGEEKAAGEDHGRTPAVRGPDAETPPGPGPDPVSVRAAGTSRPTRPVGHLKRQTHSESVRTLCR